MTDPAVRATSAFQDVLSDFAPVREALLDARMTDLASAVAEDAGHIGRASEWSDRQDETMLLRVNGSTRRFDVGESTGLGELKAGIADYLQDEVVDQLGEPWPVIDMEGHARVLEPRVLRDGTGDWCSGDTAYRPIGELWR